MLQTSLSKAFRFGIAFFAVIGLVCLGIAVVHVFGVIRTYWAMTAIFCGVMMRFLRTVGTA